MRKNEKGFTLVELIVVIAIVAILAAVGIIGYTQFISNARNTKAQSELDQLINVLYADSLVEGITIDGELLVDVPSQGKVVFKNDITETEFKALMDKYNADGVLKGTFTLSSGNLEYEVDGGTGKAVVVYDSETTLTYTYTPPTPPPPSGD
jgi:prepilin-type N-terminal cleavage/methylation domain-containing protein